MGPSLVALWSQARRDKSRGPGLTGGRGERGLAGVGRAAAGAREEWAGLALGGSAQCWSTERHLG